MTSKICRLSCLAPIMTGDTCTHLFQRERGGGGGGAIDFEERQVGQGRGCMTPGKEG